MAQAISVIIPAYNEERRITDTLKTVKAYLAEHHPDHELIVVDDGSKDKTVQVVKAFAGVRLLQNGVNKGKGYSVRKGMLAAKKDFILFSDADLSTPISELAKMLPHIEKNDIVIGSRRMRGSHILVQQPWYRRLPGMLFPFVVYILILRGIRDTQCGFKLFRKDVAHRLFPMQKLERFSFDAEILLLAQKCGYSIKEVPVIWNNALDSKLNAITDSFSMLVELLKVRMNLIFGRYKLPK